MRSLLEVNPDITQHVVFCSDAWRFLKWHWLEDMREKEDWLDKILRECGQNQCIVFVNTKRMCGLAAVKPVF